MQHSTDEQAIREVIARYTQAWNDHDMKAYADEYTPDAHFVNVIGIWLKGREEIRRQHEELHASRMKNSGLTGKCEFIRFIRPDVAIVQASWEMTFDQELAGRSQEVRRGLLTHAMVKEEGRWMISTSQNVEILPLKKWAAAFD